MRWLHVNKNIITMKIKLAVVSGALALLLHTVHFLHGERILAVMHVDRWIDKFLLSRPQAAGQIWPMRQVYYKNYMYNVEVNNENKGEERSDYREVRKRQALSEKEERTERALLFFSFLLFSAIVFSFFLFFNFFIPLTPNKDQDHTEQTGHVKDRGMYPVCGFYDGMENIEIYIICMWYSPNSVNQFIKTLSFFPQGINNLTLAQETALLLQSCHD